METTITKRQLQREMKGNLLQTWCGMLCFTSAGPVTGNTCRGFSPINFTTTVKGGCSPDVYVAAEVYVFP